jgi:hypothetical protein
VSRKARKAGPAMSAAKLKSMGPLRDPFATQGRSYADRVPHRASLGPEANHPSAKVEIFPPSPHMSLHQAFSPRCVETLP